MASFEQGGWPIEPQFTAPSRDVELFDVWNPYFEGLGGALFPKAVQLPIGGIPTEEGAAIFGNHFRVMEQRQREWRVAGQLFNTVRKRLLAPVPLLEDGETVLALPRTDFDDSQNQMAQDGLVNRALSAFADRTSFDFPENFEASRDLPRHTKVNADGTVELVQELPVLPLVVGDDLAISGAFVAVKRLYGASHEQFAKDVKSVIMTLSPTTTVTEGHQQHPSLSDTWRDDEKLDRSDDAIIERLNGQRPRTYDWGTVL
jgi:hypothetical protein